MEDALADSGASDHRDIMLEQHGQVEAEAAHSESQGEQSFPDGSQQETGSQQDTFTSPDFAPVGKVGSVYIQDKLSSSMDPMKFMNDFQLRHGLHVPGCQSVLPFLDVFGVSRGSLYKSVYESLKEKLMGNIETCNEAQLTELLEKTYPYIEQEELADIPFAVMRRHPAVPADCLLYISNTESLYRACPIEVKRKVWVVKGNENAQKRFRDEVFPCFNEFMSEPAIVQAANDLVEINSMPPKKRRHHPSIVKIVELVGQSAAVHEKVVELLEKLFKNTRNRLLCTLRSEVLMAFHDADISEICEADRCHKFVWALDACKMQNTKIDDRRIKELQLFFEKKVPAHDKMIGDVGMILYDPFTTNLLVSSIYDYVQELLESQKLPKTHDKLKFLSQLIGLGAAAHNIVESGTYEIPSVDKDLISGFLPEFMERVVEEQIRSTQSAAGLPQVELEDLSNEFVEQLEYGELSQKLVCLHVISRIQRQQLDSVPRLLQALAAIDTLDNSVYESLKNLALASRKDENGSIGEDVPLVLLQEFFLPLARRSVALHLEAVHLLLEMQNARPLGTLEIIVLKLLDEASREQEEEGELTDLQHAYMQLQHRMSGLPHASPDSSAHDDMATQLVLRIEELMHVAEGSAAATDNSTADVVEES